MVTVRVITPAENEGLLVANQQSQENCLTILLFLKTTDYGKENNRKSDNNDKCS